MAGQVFVIVKVTILHYETDLVIKKYFQIKFNYLIMHLYFVQYFYVKYFSYGKLRYTDRCNFLTTCALVSQQSILMVAKDFKISYYLNSSTYSPTIIPAIV